MKLKADIIGSIARNMEAENSCSRSTLMRAPIAGFSKAGRSFRETGGRQDKNVDADRVGYRLFARCGLDHAVAVETARGGRPVGGQHGFPCRSEQSALK